MACSALLFKSQQDITNSECQPELRVEDSPGNSPSEANSPSHSPAVSPPRAPTALRTESNASLWPATLPSLALTRLPPFPASHSASRAEALLSLSPASEPVCLQVPCWGHPGFQLQTHSHSLSRSQLMWPFLRGHPWPPQSKPGPSLETTRH